MPIIYIHQPDELARPVAQLTIDDDTSGWWAGTQRCFASVALATAIAAGSLGTALAQNVQQPTEDVVSAAVPFVANEDYWTNSAPPLAAVNFISPACVFDGAEIVPPATPPFTPDEDFWQTLLVQGRQLPAMLPWPQPFALDAQDLPSTSPSQIDEDYWSPALPVQSLANQTLYPTPDQADFVFIPPPSLDEDFWPSPLGRPQAPSGAGVGSGFASQLSTQLWSDADFVFASSPAAVFDEDFWPLFAATTQWFATTPVAVNWSLGTGDAESANLNSANPNNGNQDTGGPPPDKIPGPYWIRRNGQAQGLFDRKRWR